MGMESEKNSNEFRLQFLRNSGKGAIPAYLCVLSELLIHAAQIRKEKSR